MVERTPDARHAANIVEQLIHYERPENQHFDGYDIYIAEFHEMFKRCPVTMILEIISASFNNEKLH